MSSMPIPTMHFASSPRSPSSTASSPSGFSSSPNGFTPSPTDSMLDIFPRYSSSTSGPSCAFPSWPSGKSLAAFPGSAPSAFISDEDLFPEDLDSSEVDVRSATLLREAPSPPRAYPCAPAPMVARPAPEKPKKRSRTVAKPRRSSKPMKTIKESPEDVE